jgi:uncharacterized protein YprB with RNaseH-like and TPR domain
MDAKVDYLCHGLGLDRHAVRSAVENGDFAGLTDMLGERAQHRIAAVFPDRVLYLDIETTGFGYKDIITLVGWSKAGRYGCLIHGGDREELLGVLEDAKVIVTFNGRTFDLPRLRHHMPDLPLPALHLDLMLLPHTGISGRQKDIEVELGIARPEELQGMSGREAVWLWKRFESGDGKALQRLIEYNRADVEGMVVIAAHCLNKAARAEGIPEMLLPDWIRVVSRPPARSWRRDAS